MAKIFINYRRDDSAPYAGRLYDRLASHFGHDQLFMDIDQIEPGEVFDQVIQEKLKAVQVAVVLIGKQWLNIADATGQRRLDNPDDWVRLEIAALLERDIRVIPVLVGGATLPKATQLPECLVPLTRRQTIEITDHRFHADVDKLIKVLEKIMGEPPPKQPEPTIKPDESGKSGFPRFAVIAGVAGIVLAAGVYFGGMPSKRMPIQTEMEDQTVESIAAVAPVAETQPVSIKAPVTEQPQAIIPTPASTPVIEQSVKIELETKQSVDSSPAETNSATTKESIAVLPQQTMFTATDQPTQKIPPVMRKPVLESRNEESPVEKKNTYNRTT
ncbi:MAG: TIR domain-containing protein [Proteobacteria bacterium]|nr:TIR domain-containing protein [Pseudomonadota bacterium]